MVTCGTHRSKTRDRRTKRLRCSKKCNIGFRKNRSTGRCQKPKKKTSTAKRRKPQKKKTTSKRKPQKKKTTSKRKPQKKKTPVKRKVSATTNLLDLPDIADLVNLNRTERPTTSSAASNRSSQENDNVTSGSPERSRRGSGRADSASGGTIVTVNAPLKVEITLPDVISGVYSEAFGESCITFTKTEWENRMKPNEIGVTLPFCVVLGTEWQESEDKIGSMFNWQNVVEGGEGEWEATGLYGSTTYKFKISNDGNTFLYEDKPIYVFLEVETTS